MSVWDIIRVVLKYQYNESTVKQLRENYLKKLKQHQFELDKRWCESNHLSLEELMSQRQQRIEKFLKVQESKKLKVLEKLIQK